MAIKLSTAGASDAARELSAGSREHASRSGDVVPTCLVNKACSQCGSVFVPGVTSKHRIVPITSRRRRTLERKQSRGQVNGYGKGGVVKRSRNFHVPNNEMRIICHLCDTVTRLPGSAPLKKRTRNEKFMAAAAKQRDLGQLPVSLARSSSPGSSSSSSSDPSLGFLLLDPKRHRKSKPGGNVFAKLPSQLEMFLSNIQSSGEKMQQQQYSEHQHPGRSPAMDRR